MYKPLYRNKKKVHDEDCEGGNLLSCSCWYSWGWVVAYYLGESENPTTIREFWERQNPPTDTTSSTRLFWQGFDDGEYAREVSFSEEREY